MSKQRNLLAAAIAGLVLTDNGLAQGSQPPSVGTDHPGPIPYWLAQVEVADAKHACKGKNACKGQGGCKARLRRPGDGQVACAGRNSCKGQGGCAVPPRATTQPAPKINATPDPAPIVTSSPATEAAPVRSALHKSAAKGDLDGVRAQVDAGADPKAADSAGDTALHLAASRGDWRLVEYLLSQGVEVGSTNARGETPLHLAARQGALETVEALIKSGAPLSTRDRAGLTPLEVARKCTQGSPRQVQAALQNAGAE